MVAPKPARVVNTMPRFAEEAERKAARAMSAALILGASEASFLTPIDTSNLLNSQFRRVDVAGGAVVGVVGYTADYAAVVHSPERPQNFRRASAEKEFLLKGFERAEDQIRAMLTGALRV